MIQNIFSITLVIILFFLISNEKKIDQIIHKKYMKYLLLLLIIYFIYQNYNFGIFVLIIIVFILFNTDIKKKLEKNKYLNLEQYKDLAKEYFSNMNDNNSYEVKPYKDDNNNKNNISSASSSNSAPASSSIIVNNNSTNNISNNQNNSNKKVIEPFKDEVQQLKEMYDNIKLEISKLG
jgi:Ca2+/Na+ antiporter